MEPSGWNFTRSSVRNMGSDKIRDLLIMFDSVRYDRFVEAHTPILDSLGEAALAYTHGTWSRPSMMSILSGYLPYNKKYKNPYSMTHKLLGSGMCGGKEVSSFFFNANDWMLHAGPKAYQEITGFGSFPAKKMVEGAKELMEREKEFFIAMIFPESHLIYEYQPEPDPVKKRVVQLFGDFNKGQDNDAPAVAAERSRKVISHLDQVIKPLLPLAERVIFTSDHGDLMGEHHLIGHDPGYPFHEVLLKVPLIIGDLS